MEKRGNWFPMPRKELFLLIGIFLYAGIFFLPWAQNMMLLNISVVAWSSYFVFIAGPLIFIIFLHTEKRHVKSEKDENVPG